MAHSGWQVTSQATDQVIVTAAGQAITGTSVFFQTGEGNSGSVFVPDNIYPDTAKVRAMLHEKATQIDTVGNLHAGPHTG